ncbi:hypothetical protein QJS10_CPA02g01276 [Acorus calamus]|uniref:Uncharacterized protein n=1 Tax=Acorus calamus TaxID=4465 RepID=A0AAV9FD80_ACOCL|nr:hypothetical protein QJS10_CPA02g01276 [Acorus calamus]
MAKVIKRELELLKAQEVFEGLGDFKIKNSSFRDFYRRIKNDIIAAYERWSFKEPSQKMLRKREHKRPRSATMGGPSYLEREGPAQGEILPLAAISREAVDKGL